MFLANLLSTCTVCDSCGQSARFLFAQHVHDSWCHSTSIYESADSGQSKSKPVWIVENSYHRLPELDVCAGTVLVVFSIMTNFRQKCFF